jgi:hypothetical protein
MNWAAIAPTIALNWVIVGAWTLAEFYHRGWL